MPEPGLLPSTRSPRFPRYYEPLRLPQRPEDDLFSLPGWRSQPATDVGLSRCLDDLVCMPPPLPRLETMGSPVGCSAIARRPSPDGRRVGSSKKLSRPAQGSLALRPAHLPLDSIQVAPEASAESLTATTAPAATGVHRQFPGRDFHPLAIETQKTHPVSLHQLKMRLLS